MILVVPHFLLLPHLLVFMFLLLHPPVSSSRPPSPVVTLLLCTGIQNQNASTYGKYEAGNKMSYSEFEAYVASAHPEKAS